MSDKNLIINGVKVYQDPDEVDKLRTEIAELKRLAREDLPETDLDFFAATDGDSVCGVCEHKITNIDSLCEVRGCRRFQLRKLLKVEKSEKN